MRPMRSPVPARARCGQRVRPARPRQCGLASHAARAPRRVEGIDRKRPGARALKKPPRTSAPEPSVVSWPARHILSSLMPPQRPENTHPVDRGVPDAGPPRSPDLIARRMGGSAPSRGLVRNVSGVLQPLSPPRPSDAFAVWSMCRDTSGVTGFSGLPSARRHATTRITARAL